MAGFGVPIREWFGSELGARLESLLDAGRAHVEPDLEADEVKRGLRARQRTVNEAFQLWVIYNLLNWRLETISQPRLVMA